MNRPGIPGGSITREDGASSKTGVSQDRYQGNLLQDRYQGNLFVSPI
jgi:hypothetical protein